ncbi:MAG: transcriptional regulator [Spirochaetia bacterium]|jgi:DNA-binding MarR family transcriptional regulator|nr:transcriptional regulator [Spirochaetia bacterium]
MIRAILPDPEKIIHERARLRILVYLASSPETEIGFPALRQDLAMSSGNLSIQLRTLEEAGYIAVHKSFKARKPYTGVRISPEGEAALSRYLDEIESMLSSVRKKYSDEPKE